MNNLNQNNSVRQAIEIAVNLGLIFIIVYWCMQILSPFTSFILWGAIISISVYTPFLMLRKAIGGSNKLAVIIIAVIGLTLVIVPAWMFGESLISGAQTITENAKSGSFNIKPPAESVKEWPVVGKKLYNSWSDAASNFQAWLETNHDQVYSIARVGLTKIAGLGLSVLEFVLSVLIAAAFLASAESAKSGMQRCFTRLAGDRGSDLLNLSVATIRSVTVGVLGIAFLQALGGGLGMMVVGIPGAGLWALAILVLAIAQLPPWLILGPMIVYVFSQESSTVAIVFMVWSLFVSISDAFLKPMFLGRGVDAPMLVILLGAIGGMIMSGIMGLFVGAVVLALGYTLFQSWLNMGEGSESEDEPKDSDPNQPASAD